MARKKVARTSWLDGAVEIPREQAVGWFKKRQRQQLIYRICIRASIILLPITLIGIIGILGNLPHGSTNGAGNSQVDPESRAAATLAVQSWLNNTPSPVPGKGSIVSWNTETRVARPAQTDQQKQTSPLPTYRIDIENYTIVDGDGQTYSTDVQVANDPSSGAQVIDTPSLTPIASSASASVGPLWYGLNEVPAPSPVQTAVNAWANAYTSGSSDTLGQAVGDPNPQHAFVPLGGVVAHTVTTGKAAYLPVSGQTSVSSSDPSDLMVVRASLAVQYVGQPAIDPTKPANVITFDLLVKKANTAAPVVVAWTGPGLGASAQPYQNALTNRKPTIIVPGQNGGQQ